MEIKRFKKPNLINEIGNFGLRLKHVSTEGKKIVGLFSQIGLSNIKSNVENIADRVISSVETNLFLGIEAQKEKERILHNAETGNINIANIGRPINQNNSDDAMQTRVSDLAKMNYKEVYEAYKLGDAHIRNDWREINFVDDLKSGFDARVFVNDKTKEINIAFEGSHGFTKLLAENGIDGPFFRDLYNNSDGFKRHATEEEYNKLYQKWHLVLGEDGLSDLQIFAGKIPDQFYTAYAWFEKIEKQLTNKYSGYKQLLSGHSLGGGVAQLVSAQYTVDTGKTIPTIALEGPGMLPQLQQLTGRKDLKPGDFSNIVNFVTEGDPVGEFFYDQHVGLSVKTPYTLANNDEYMPIKYRGMMDMYLKATGCDKIPIDRHEIGQQIYTFDGTDISYPQNRIILNNGTNTYRETSNKNELIMCNDGNDTVYAGSGNDIICGGSGNNTIYGGSGNDYIYGGTGNSTIYAGSGNNMIYGGSGDDVIYCGTGNNRIYGGKGKDTFVWSGGNDLLYGQQGDDIYILGNSEDGAKVKGDVTMQFDREVTGKNDHVMFGVSAIDGQNSHFTFKMGDHILPSDFTIKQDGDKLLVGYDGNSITVDNWAQAKDLNITFKFGCDPISAEYKVDHSSLVKIA